MKKYREFDVIILGAGLAGLYTALNLDPSLKVGIFVKDKINKGSSYLAQGGIAAETVYDKDQIQEHYEDTLKAGSFYNNNEAVKILVNDAPVNVENLIKMGVNFDKTKDGQLLKTLEGGHRSRRVLHAGGDATGFRIMNDLMEYAKSKTNLEFFSEEMAFEIIHKDNCAHGIITIDIYNEVNYYFANKIIIATGGIGGIFKNSTNEKFACGDGIALAYRAGIDILNMEFIQFHPTGLYEELKRGQRFLISEAVRGEGAVLRNIEGVRFMQKYSPLLDLAPRDIVSQSIYREMFDTWSDHVYLDIRHKTKEYLENRFPTIYKKCLEIGIDMSKDLIPVSPIEHFLCGGISVDLNGKTSMQNLYAVGECSNTGVHGANRLASNSLLECVVFANKIASDINNLKETYGKRFIMFNNEHCEYKPFNFKSIRVEIRDVMDKYVSIVRTKEGLDIAKKIIVRHYNNLNKINVLSRYYIETLNMATCALLVIEAAIKREDSLGCHYRID